MNREKPGGGGALGGGELKWENLATYLEPSFSTYWQKKRKGTQKGEEKEDTTERIGRDSQERSTPSSPSASALSCRLDGKKEWEEVRRREGKSTRGEKNYHARPRKRVRPPDLKS